MFLILLTVITIVIGLSCVNDINTDNNTNVSSIIYNYFIILFFNRKFEFRLEKS